MPKNKLYKYRCKELVCNAIVRSDKWNNHCRQKHKVKYHQNLEIKKEIISVRDGKNWRTYVGESASEPPITVSSEALYKSNDDSDEPSQVNRLVHICCNLTITPELAALQNFKI